MNNIKKVLVALRRVIQATDLHSKHLAKTAGLTAPQILLLQAIQDETQATVGTLARSINLSQATVTTIIDRLETRGLVCRSRSQQDKRKVHVSLTEAGTAAVKSAPLPLQAHFVDRFSRLEEWEQMTIIASLQRVAKMMDATDIDAAPVLDVGQLDRQSTDAP